MLWHVMLCQVMLFYTFYLANRHSRNSFSKFGNRFRVNLSIRNRGLYYRLFEASILLSADTKQLSGSHRCLSKCRICKENSAWNNQSNQQIDSPGPWEPRTVQFWCLTTIIIILIKKNDNKEKVYWLCFSQWVPWFPWTLQPLMWKAHYLRWF